MKVGDVMERTKWGAEGWRRNSSQSVGLKVGDVMERTSGGTKVLSKCGAEGCGVMERTKCGAEGWRRNGKNEVWG